MRIIVIANKWWEVEPLSAAFRHASSGQPRYSAVPIGSYEQLRFTLAGTAQPAPRLSALCNSCQVDFWCLQDIMNPNENSSLTMGKARVLHHVARESSQEDVVIAFGTAASPSGAGCSGTVVVGTGVFVHDAFSESMNPQNRWTHPAFDQIVRSDCEEMLNILLLDFIRSAESRLLPAPNDSASPPKICLGNDLISLGVVNVENSADYAWADARALGKFNTFGSRYSAASVETTHGLIRLLLGSRFLYVSGITNTIGQFKEHVGTSPYSQTLVAAHNAAITLAWLLPELASAIRLVEAS